MIDLNCMFDVVHESNFEIVLSSLSFGFSSDYP
jgi:hypothetical protein